MISLKQKIIIIVTLAGAILIFIFQHGLYSKPQPISPSSPKPTLEVQISPSEEPKVISTHPDNLDGTTLLPTQIIEITFNRPLENVGEFKNRLEPKTNYEVKLSDDRKTARIIPNPTFKLGAGYTIFILPDTKFYGKKTLGREIIYHFNTVSYKGI